MYIRVIGALYLLIINTMQITKTIKSLENDLILYETDHVKLQTSSLIKNKIIITPSESNL